MPRAQASAFGVIKTAPDGRQVEAFLEKPADPPGLPDSPDEAFVSMGNYVFDADKLIEAVVRAGLTAAPVGVDHAHDQMLAKVGADILALHDDRDYRYLAEISPLRFA